MKRKLEWSGTLSDSRVKNEDDVEGAEVSCRKIMALVGYFIFTMPFFLTEIMEERCNFYSHKSLKGDR